MSRVAVFLLVAILLPAAARAITPEQAQKMSMTELARAVLGEAGDTVVRVERPTWLECAGFCPPITAEEAERGKGPPPLSLGLAFYQRPTAVSELGSNWVGLCKSVIIGVGFNEKNQVTGVSTTDRYDVPERMTVADAPKLKDFHAVRIARDRMCAERWTTKGGFIADRESSAYRVAAAIAWFEEKASASRPVGVKVRCSSIVGICDQPDQNREIASLLRPERIRSVQQIGCAKEHDPVVLFGPDGCYRVNLMEAGKTAVLEIVDAYSDLKLRRVDYSRIQVVY